MSNLLHWSYQNSSSCSVVVDEDNSEALAKTDENILKNATTKTRVSAALGGMRWSKTEHGLVVEMVELLHGAHEPANAHAALLSNPNLDSDPPIWSSRRLLEYQDEEQDTEENNVDIVPLTDDQKKIQYQNMMYDHNINRNEIVYKPPESNNIIDVKNTVFETMTGQVQHSDHIMLNISIASDNKMYQPVSLSFELPTNADVKQIKLDSLSQTTVKPSTTTLGTRSLGSECQCFCPCLDKGNWNEVKSNATVGEVIEQTPRPKEDNITAVVNNGTDVDVVLTTPENTDSVTLVISDKNSTLEFLDVLNSTEAETYSSEEYYDVDNVTEDAISTMASEEPFRMICTGNAVLYSFNEEVTYLQINYIYSVMSQISIGRLISVL